jgi:surfactin synthase thioesterase subunit
MARRAQLSDDDLVAALAELDPQTGSDLASPMIRSNALGNLRADLAVFEAHVPSSPAPLACNMTVFGGRHDPAVSLDQLRGWEVWTRGRVRYIEVDGNHFFIRPQRAAILAAMLDALEVESSTKMAHRLHGP